MKVLVVGGGAREVSLAWKCVQSPTTKHVYLTPGNGGVERFGIKRVPIIPKDYESFGSLAKFARRKKIDLIVVGPDHLIAMGLVDYLRLHGFVVLGPTRDAGKIEWWKPFGKAVMVRCGIATAPYRVFDNYHEARAYVEEYGVPIVIKAAGLALGKGAFLCRTMEKAFAALYSLMVQKVHGTAGECVVVEKFLVPSGIEEFSAHALVSGRSSRLFPMSQDHKHIGEGDTGDMTGGTGVVLPINMPRDVCKEVKNVLNKTINRMHRKGATYDGFLYPGFMQTTEGIMLLEYNARGGDPEIPAYMRHLKSDLPAALYACATRDLSQVRLHWHEGAVANVVLMSRGYPTLELDIGYPITGIEEAERIPGVVVFHAGVEEVDGTLYTAGGRVLNITATGSTLKEALERAYQAADIIKFEGKYYRRDIGRKALEHGLAP